MMLRSRPVRGISLIEVVSVFAVIGALLTMSVTVLARAGKVYGRAVETVASLEASRSLAARLRNDAGRALRATRADDGGLLFDMPEQRRVRYAVGNKTDVLREVLVDGQPSGRDRWHFEVPLELQCSVDAPTAGQEERLALTRVRLMRETSSPHSLDGVVVNVVARIGNLRLQTLSAANKDQQAQETGQ